MSVFSSLEAPRVFTIVSVGVAPSNVSLFPLSTRLPEFAVRVSEFSVSPPPMLLIVVSWLVLSKTSDVVVALAGTPASQLVPVAQLPLVVPVHVKGAACASRAVRPHSSDPVRK